MTAVANGPLDSPNASWGAYQALDLALIEPLCEQPRLSATRQRDYLGAYAAHPERLGNPGAAGVDTDPASGGRTPAAKCLEQFDYRQQTTIMKRQVNQRLDLRFIEERTNLVFTGPPA